MKKIFVAEDDIFIKDLTEARLLKAGYQVASTSDGAAVIFEVLQHKPDLLLLDIKLPHKTGLEILAEIRNTLEIADLPVLLFTNENGPEIDAAVDKFGAQYFLKVSAGTGELIEKIERMLS